MKQGRPIMVLGNLHRSSFVLAGRHSENPRQRPGIPSLLFRRSDQLLTLAHLRALNPIPGSLVYHAYLPTRQLGILRQEWPDVHLHPIVFAEPGTHRIYQPVALAFLQEFGQVDVQRPSHLAQGAWDLWLRAHNHADQWLGDIQPWTAYDLIDSNVTPVPPPPPPYGSPRAFFRRWKEEILRAHGVKGA